MPVIGAKRLALGGEDASQITEFILQVLSPPKETETEDSPKELVN
jgi:hypothetical protein